MGYYEGMWGLEGLVNDKLFWKGQRAELAENDRLEELNEKILKWWKEMSGHESNLIEGNSECSHGLAKGMCVYVYYICAQQSPVRQGLHFPTVLGATETLSSKVMITGTFGKMNVGNFSPVNIRNILDNFLFDLFGWRSIPFLCKAP
jgi:hypothetical protein